eukprot:1355862-Pleurochrysis_carterae.AAC.1
MLGYACVPVHGRLSMGACAGESTQNMFMHACRCAPAPCMRASACSRMHAYLCMQAEASMHIPSQAYFNARNPELAILELEKGRAQCQPTRRRSWLA